MPKIQIIAAVALGAALCVGSQAMSAEPQFYSSEGARKANLPFSQAVKVGEVLYLSGQLGNKPDGTLPDGMEAQARQAMDNIGAVLKRSDLGFGDVVKCTVMLDNMADWPAFNKVYVTYFPGGKFPARSAFGADGLAMGALLEVECWAYAGKRG